MVDHSPAKATDTEVRSWRDELGAAHTTYDVFRAMRRIANAFGFSGFVVMRSLEPGATKIEPAMILNSLNPDFVRAFDNMHLLTPSHYLHAVGKSLEPVVRLRSQLSAESYDGHGLEVRDLLQDFGITCIVVLPVHSRYGRKGIVGFTGAEESVALGNLYGLHYLAMIGHDKLLSLQAPDRPPQAILTDRERECLSWTAAGKTSIEIAAILGISSHTVDHYLTTAGQKLNTVNRAHTVATALRCGIIS